MAAARVSAALNGSGFWVLVFVLIVGVTQIGSLEREVIDWDESVFILMAANILDGHLPYVEMFDNKPQLIFFMLAGVMAVFGESLLVVRLFGDVCILASCAAVFAIARRWTDPISAGLGTLTFIVWTISTCWQVTVPPAADARWGLSLHIRGKASFRPPSSRDGGHHEMVPLR